MRRRVLLLACALGAASVIGLTPQAHAGCTSVRIFDSEKRCLEEIVCELVGDVPCVCPLTSH